MTTLILLHKLLVFMDMIYENIKHIHQEMNNKNDMVFYSFKYDFLHQFIENENSKSSSKHP
jgi:archaellum component FlaF (FlaF/FlaG flagellin family)